MSFQDMRLHDNFDYVTPIRDFCTWLGYTNEGDEVTLTLETGPVAFSEVYEKILKPCKAHAERLQKEFNGIKDIEEVPSSAQAELLAIRRTITFYVVGFYY